MGEIASGLWRLVGDGEAAPQMGFPMSSYDSIGPGVFTQVATSTWVALGGGPLQIQTTGTNVLVAIGDNAPAGDVGFTLAEYQLLDYAGASAVWIELRPGSAAAGRGGAVRYTWLNQVLVPATGFIRLITRRAGITAS